MSADASTGVDASTGAPTSLPGRDPPDSSVVAELERVELAARERRLMAQAEADRIEADAAAAAADIERGVEARREAALAELRSGYLQRAAADVALIDEQIAALDGPGAPSAAVPGFEAAVERIVAAVLAEPEG